MGLADFVRIAGHRPGRAHLRLWAVAVLLVAMWGPMPHARASEPVDPCAMLSLADAESALGEPASREARGNASEGRKSIYGTCTYFSAKDALRFVGYTITRWKEPKDAETARLVLPKGYEKRGSELTEVSGLGTAAFWDGSSLFVFRGDAQITVSISNAAVKDVEARLARARGVASAILAKL